MKHLIVALLILAIAIIGGKAIDLACDELDRLGNEKKALVAQTLAAESDLELVCRQAGWQCVTWDDETGWLCANTSEVGCYPDVEGGLIGITDWAYIEDLPHLAPYRADSDL